MCVIVWFIMQVENLKAVHPDYGNRVQALLDKYNVEAQKVKKEKSLSSVKLVYCFS